MSLFFFLHSSNTLNILNSFSKQFCFLYFWYLENVVSSINLLYIYIFASIVYSKQEIYFYILVLYTSRLFCLILCKYLQK